MCLVLVLFVGLENVSEAQKKATRKTVIVASKLLGTALLLHF